MRVRIVILLFVPLIIGFTISSSDKEKINGINLVAPPKPFEGNPLSDVHRVNAKWISVIPYAFCEKDKPEIHYPMDWQWWGERPEGVVKTIQDAKSNGFQVMLKPHVWVRDQGWAGEFDLKTEQEWLQWEESYSNYILLLAKIADSLSVEMFCIGTEYKIAVSKRPEFWPKLISSMKTVYSGKLTYAANWDNYHNIPFWKELDYIGIDAYFPLSNDTTPSKIDLKNAWLTPLSEIKKFSKKHDRLVLFTEYGYRNTDKAASAHWELEEHYSYKGNVNPNGQLNAYAALFESFWEESWFAGGFLWKWYHDHSNAGGLKDSDFTPQNKPAQVIIRDWYGKKLILPDDR